MARFPQVYRKAEWQRAREFVTLRSGGLCEACLKQGRVEPGLEIDHIIELTERNWQDWNVAYNPDNLQNLCKPCHDTKHGRVQETGLDQFVSPVDAGVRQRKAD